MVENWTFYLPELKVAIEYNGDYWHSSNSIRFENEDEGYLFHKEKFSQCLNSNIILLTVWKKDWLNETVEVKKLIKDALILDIYSPILFKFNSSKIL